MNELIYLFIISFKYLLKSWFKHMSMYIKSALQLGPFVSMMTLIIRSMFMVIN